MRRIVSGIAASSNASGPKELTPNLIMGESMPFRRRFTPSEDAPVRRKYTRSFGWIHLMLLGLVGFMIVTFCIHFALTDHDTTSSREPLPTEKLGEQRDSTNEVVFSFIDEFGIPVKSCKDASDLDYRVKELSRIRLSVMNELRDLDTKRRANRVLLDKEIETLEQIRVNVTKEKRALENVYNELHMSQLALDEVRERNTPEVRLPSAPLLPPVFTSTPPPAASNRRCSLESCFDDRRCSITTPFSVFLYPLTSSTSRRERALYAAFASLPYRVKDAAVACLLVVFLGRDGDRAELAELSDWNGGLNHVVLDFTKGGVEDTAALGYAMLVGEALADYRQTFDLVAPLQQNTVTEDDVWRILPPLLPAKRKYLASFGANYHDQVKSKPYVDALKMIESTKTSDKFSFTFSCVVEGNNAVPDLCGSENERLAVLRQSVFALILPSSTDRQSNRPESSRMIVTKLVEALRSGSIAVLVDETSRLPLDETIDWRRAVVRVRPSRLAELHFLLRAISVADRLQFRQQATRIYTTYFATDKAIAESIAATLRARVGVAAHPAPHAIAEPLLRDRSWYPSNAAIIETDIDEYLGPIEMPHPSLTFQQNFTLLSQHSNRVWNDYFEPFRLHASLPNSSPLMPTEARFHDDTDFGFRPIKGGAGGSGNEFSESLGGNLPREQFTAVILTYKRETVLGESLQRLNRLPYLNKVVVVWNGPDLPSEQQIWPKLNVPVLFIKGENNSLNNRFLPYREIETDAVLSIDDDVRLTQAEIVFAFRVWRENRERIVGFPGRYHAWDTEHRSWLYNSNHSCELSMVLTGAAFIHRYYLHAYTYQMPSAIRQKVDELINCEDLAMNFLVAHLTRQPPLKVTTKWTFRCPGCPDTLSVDESHFVERHRCIQLFSRVYGYNPLLNSQYRADSVLFKTRLPHQHQHCFKFI